ncbi:hypothetical protein ACIP9X_19415 [Arthrobacter sp. NPDC093125]|uniref:hypothetical protein n=1 Tax=Arthrobacter sp. NPDC093125 TaxID=3363944 RepID=UPI0037FF2AC6
MAALAGADNETEAAGLLHHLPDLQDAPTGTRMAWARWYQRSYPGPRFWNPLEPDLLGSTSSQPSTPHAAPTQPNP